MLSSIPAEGRGRGSSRGGNSEVNFGYLTRIKMDGELRRGMRRQRQNACSSSIQSAWMDADDADRKLLHPRVIGNSFHRGCCHMLCVLLP